ncbi:molybdenum cofactor guanylyltransferase MobA [Martelella radicis]|uniref:Molybdenum cofactor guanylyltransferase n=1 Tax=Martelella radicis TaxID=1397476 RepID=A0A7W6KLR7_9HYPH|nr:molybdenum cofactor guanylyltransferase MobA [Martelella radicis]MBB4123512.1 molybdopterin-guanine dinucleotide biosynthesis protein A [Martelella radicis]
MTPFPAVILAGGASRRMGTDKAMLTLEGETLLARAHRRIKTQAHPVLISRHGDDLAGLPDATVIRDAGTGHEGPLAGILAGLRHLAAQGSEATHMVSLAVDTSFFPADLVERLAAASPAPDAIVLARTDDRVHPVFALWPLVLREPLEDWLASGVNRRLMDFVREHQSRIVDFPLIPAEDGAIDPFFNVNTPDDLAAARHIAKRIAQT